VAPDVSVGGRTPIPAAVVRRVVGAVLRAERATARVAALSVTFLGPARMRALNRAHLRHDRPTDVISFALPGPDGRLVGDIYVCPSVARAQAREAGVPPREELVRLIVHGALHLLGYDHPEGAGRFRSAMWRRQERLVRRLA
jgi:probable rRNA maturation factor